MSPITLCRAELQKRFPGREILFAGRATTAIHAILRALKLPAKAEVVLPAFCCPNVALAVEWAGLKVKLCDTRLDDFTLDTQALSRLVGKRTGAILAVHLFGHPCNMRAILAMARPRGVFVIEDCAQSLGSNDGKSPTGLLGDAAVFSFGYKKTIDVGGGSAILLKDASLAERVRTVLDPLPAFTSRFDDLFLRFRKRYYDLSSLTATRPRDLRALHEEYRQMYFHRMEHRFAKRLLPELKNLRSNLIHRRRIAGYYEREFRKLRGLKLPRVKPGSTVWRYTLATDRRDELVDRLRGHGIPVSTLYPSLTNEFDVRANARHSRLSERLVLNLMTDVSEKDAERTVILIRDVMNS